ncbi:hypothetical protein Tco_0666952 [Tanacetum coccineum]
MISRERRYTLEDIIRIGSFYRPKLIQCQHTRDLMKSFIGGQITQQVLKECSPASKPPNFRKPITINPEVNWIRYCPPFMTAKQLEDIHNFKQKGDESLYQAWERYNDLLYKCPTHDINSHQKGPIPGMRPTEALTAIQTMADHSQKWHDDTTSRNIRSSSSKDGLAALVGCQICKRPHLNKDYPLNEEVKQVEEVRYGEFGRTTPFNGNNRGRQTLAETVKKYIKEASLRLEKQDEWLKTFCHNLEKIQNHHNEIIQGLKSRVTTLAKEAVTMIDNNEDCKAIFTNDGASLYTSFYYSPEEINYFLANSGFSDDDELNNVTSILDEDLKQTSPKQTTTHYVEPYIPPIPFPRRLEQHAEEALIQKTMESLKKIKSNRPFLKEIAIQRVS